MTAASHKLYLTQPAVSLQIRSLEEELGVELLVRGARQVKPTPQGQLLYDYAKKIISLVDQTQIAIQTMGAEISGPLRVGTLNSIGLHLMGQVFELFIRNNKNVRVELRYASGRDLLEKLERQEIELAILPDSEVEFGTDPKDCDKETVFRDEIILVASTKESDIPKAIKLAEYVDYPIGHLSQEYPGFEHLLLKELKKRGRTLRPVFETSNVGSLKRVIESGVGWGFLPAHSVTKQLRTGRLQKIDVEDLKYSVDMVCYRSLGAKNSKSAEVFLKALLVR
jgi:DNA-binding transcriptional LysR family regulator